MNPPPTIIRQPDEGEVISAFGDTVQTKLSAADTGGQLSLGIVTTPSRNGPPLHRHTREDELFIIIEGIYRFVSDGEEHAAGPGAVIWLRRGTVHTFQVVSEVPGKAWIFVLPGGFESFFRASAAIFVEAAGGAPDMAKIMAAASAAGIEILGPPLE
jgi:quercetin dioxygenase-like cupin family protein